MATAGQSHRGRAFWAQLWEGAAEERAWGQDSRIFKGGGQPWRVRPCAGPGAEGGMLSLVLLPDQAPARPVSDHAPEASAGTKGRAWGRRQRLPLRVEWCPQHDTLDPSSAAPSPGLYFGNRVITDVISQGKMGLLGGGGGQCNMTAVLSRRRTFRQGYPEGGPCGDGGRLETCGHMPQDARRHLKVGEVEGPAPEPPGGAGSFQHVGLGLWPQNCTRMFSGRSQPPACV